VNRKIPLPACGRALCLRAGRLGGDQLQAAHGVGLAQRQGHHHPAGQVAACPPGLLVVQGDGHHCTLHQLLHVDAAAGQQLAQAAGHRCQRDVVDRGVTGVGDLLDEVQSAAEEG
jgi:hypothetical protein